MANKPGKIAKTATEALKILWEQGFFRAWKKTKIVEDHLAKDGYHFSGPELGMAVKRARHLTRRGKRGSYEYVQKYPFVEDKPTQAKMRKV